MRLFAKNHAWCFMPILVLLCTTHNAAAADSAEALSTPLDPAAAQAVYRIELIDGALAPETLRVPAGVRFKLLIVNSGSKPGEFESHQLRQEVVLFMGNEKTLPINPLDPGSYDYFDDFQPGVVGKIIAVDTSS